MILLHRLKRPDLEKTFQARNNPEISKWCRQDTELHWDDHVAWFDKQRTDDSIEMFGIHTNELVGVCGLTNIDYVCRRGEFSCYIFPEFQRRGICSSSLEVLFSLGFYWLNLNLIWGETFSHNPAFKLFTEKLGMKKDGVRQQFYYKDGNYIDAEMVSITRAQWDIR